MQDPRLSLSKKQIPIKAPYGFRKMIGRVNAKSLLGVLSMAISGGSTVTLIADGPDETEALNGLELLVSTEL